MELCPGTTLRDWIRVRPRGDIQAGAGTHIFRALCEALRYIHAHGLIHRDVKPANVLVHRGSSALEPTVKLMDFGLAVFDDRVERNDRGARTAYAENGGAKTSDDAKKKFSVGVGTASYCAPEQRGGTGLYSSAVDMYSTGVVLVEMLTALGAEATESERLHLSRRETVGASGDYEGVPQARRVSRELLSSDPGARPTAAAVLRRWPRVNLRGQVREKAVDDSETALACCWAAEAEESPRASAPHAGKHRRRRRGRRGRGGGESGGRFGERRWLGR